MPSFGEKLKQEREKRKISLEQISASTKIGTRMLQALEEDKFNQLPGGIFNKGFVRAYSRAVGLDEEQIVAEYLQASGDAPSPRTDIAPRDDEAHENEQHISRLEAISDTPTRQLPWGLFAALLLAVALALSLWSYRERERARQSVQTTPAVAPPPSAASGLSSTGVSGAGVSENNGVSSRTSAAPTSAATPGEFTLVIVIREDSWVSITSDGKTISSGLLAAGSERTVQGRKEIIVRTGNAGGLDFRFNGKLLDSAGKTGEVKTVTFGPSGVLPNAPAAASTP